MDRKKNRRVLVVDDNPAIHEDFRKILAADKAADKETIDLADAAEAFFGVAPKVSNRLDVHLECACQGEEGYRLCELAIEKGQPFAVAFVDMRMPPGWDGLKTISELWKLDPNLQVVICSAYSDHSWSQIREQLGDSDRLLILKKPFDNAEVLQLVTALIEKRRLTELASLRAKYLGKSVEEGTRSLSAARQDSEQLISAIESMLVGLNREGEIMRWNSHSEKLFGLSHAEVEGLKLTELPIHWDDPREISQLTRENTKRFETAFRDLQGEHRFIGVSSYAVIHNGERNGTLILGSDLTEHRALESQLGQVQKLEAVGQLAAGVAHEINTPMQYLGDNLDFLEKKVAQLAPLMTVLKQLSDGNGDNESQDSALDTLVTVAKKIKAKKFVNDLLDAIIDSRDGVHHVSKIVRAMKEFAHPGQEEKMSVDLNRALESTIAVSTNEWKYVAEIATEFDTSSPTVTALPVELNQVFLDILVNAAHAVSDATDDGAAGKGKITVATKSLGDVVQVSISDSGVGIPEDVQKRIFEPFFTTKEVGKGTGQGLSIAHSVIVKKHGGRLWCDSTPGVGTTFYMQIPVLGDEVHDAENESALVTTGA